MSASKEKIVTVPTKAVWIAAWVVMLVFVGLIFRNCVTSVVYGSKTEDAEVAYYYSQGEKIGEAGLPARTTDLDLGNPVLRKSFSKGYREGLDVYVRGSGVRSEE